MNLKNSMTEYVHIALQSPKVALSVSGGTVATGSATSFLDGIPGDITTYTAVIGASLSLVLIYTNITSFIIRRRLYKQELEVAKLEKEKLIHELEEIRGKNV